MRRLPILSAVLIVVGAGVASASGADTTTTTTTTSTTPITIKAPAHQRVAALTGLPDPTAVTKRRSALTIKMDNTPEAHPQIGVNEADVVYEEIVEGGITRLAAIFNSNLPTVVGPVRSVRRTDREIVFPIGGIFAFSGGAQYAVASIETAPVKLFDQSNAGAAMFRDPKRPPPHNLFANAAALMKEGGKVHTPPALFTYMSRGRAGGRRTGRILHGELRIGLRDSYQWDATTHRWLRSIFGAPDREANGVRVAPTNVVVMSVKYIRRCWRRGLLRPDGRVGTGRDLLRRTTAEGQVVPFARSAFKTAYRTASGKVIAFVPVRRGSNCSRWARRSASSAPK
jgi:hypothetical protein